MKSIEERVARLEDLILPKDLDDSPKKKGEWVAKTDFKWKREAVDGRDEGDATIYIEKAMGRKRLVCALGNSYRITLYADYIDIYEDAIKQMKKIKKELEL